MALIISIGILLGFLKYVLSHAATFDESDETF